MTSDEALQVSRRGLLAAGLLSASGVSNAAALDPSNRASPRGSSLRARASQKGLFCGTCLDYLQINDVRLLQSITEDCNIMIPANGFNWTRTQPTPGAALDFSQAELVYKFARSIDIPMRGHNLVWHNTVPHWAAELIPTLSVAAASRLMTDYIEASCSRWAGRLIHQEVVNEPIDGDGLVRFPFSDKLGEHYIDIAFHSARVHDPHALLFINQESIELDTRYHEKRRTQILLLLERLLKRGVPVQAFGIEGHLQLANPFSESVYHGFLAELSGMGMKLLVSEFDIIDKGATGSTPQRDADIAAMAKAFLDVSFDNPACIGMLDWSHTDKYSWYRAPQSRGLVGPQPARPSPLDDDYKHKPLWNAISAAIDGARPRHFA